MAAVPTETEFGCWQIEGRSPRIEFVPSVIEEICGAALEGLYKLRRGGVEVGGVLFGTRQDDLIRILAFRPARCEHAFGPSFVLSEKDGLALLALLEAPASDPGLNGLEPVGWYHSHTRSEIHLSQEDLEVYNRYFPDHWQIAMVVRPEQFGPARVGFFFREPGGRIHSQTAYREFSVKPSRTALISAAETEERTHAPRQQPTGKFRAIEAAAEHEVPVEAEEAEQQPEPPLFTLLQTRARRRRKWIWIPLTICLAACAGGLAFLAALPEVPANLSLRVLDVDGQLLIEWDRTSMPVREARTAVVDILDGQERSKVALDGDRLREGSITYLRRSDHVDVRFRVERPRAKPVEEFVRFLGPPLVTKPDPEVVQVMREKNELQQRLEKITAELERKNAQIRRLQQDSRRPQR